MYPNMSSGSNVTLSNVRASNSSCVSSHPNANKLKTSVILNTVRRLEEHSDGGGHYFNLLSDKLLLLKDQPVLMRHEPPTIIMLSYRLILLGLLFFPHSLYAHLHTQTPTQTRTYVCRMAVYELAM